MNRQIFRIQDIFFDMIFKNIPQGLGYKRKKHFGKESRKTVFLLNQDAAVLVVFIRFKDAVSLEGRMRMIFQERGKIRLQMIKKNTGATTENKFVAKRNHMGTHAFCENVVVFSFQKKRKKKQKERRG